MPHRQFCKLHKLCQALFPTYHSTNTMDSNKSTPAALYTGSPAMGQPMSSSYETQWLGSEHSNLHRRNSQNTNSEDSTRHYLKKSNTSKAERRALQEKQRQEKQKRIATQHAPIKEQNTPAKSTPQNSIVQQNKKGHNLQQQQKSILNHLDLPKRPDTNKHKDLHPAILTLGLLFSDLKIVGSNARCVAVLETFSKVISDHQPPANATFVRHIQKHLDPHIAFLLNVRYMSLQIREIIRWLKKEVADLVARNPPLGDEEAKLHLTERISQFIHARIVVADRLIVQYGLTKIDDGDVILTYAKSSIIEKLLLRAKQVGREFSVIVVDSRPLLEGKHLLESLTKAGIPCKYALISSIYIALKDVTKVFMGSHAILNNGCSYARVGSAAVAMAARDNQIPVMICAETYKFVNRTQVNSLVVNEKGSPDDLMHLNKQSDGEQPILAGWKQSSNLNIINLMYDVTPSKYISLVITEIGIVPCTSAPVIWREYNEEFGKKDEFF